MPPCPLCPSTGCLKAKAGGGTVKAGFHLSDPEYLVQMTQAAQLQFPGTVTHSSGVTRALMSKLTLGVDGIGISRFCKERNELAMGCYATAQLEYYSMLAPQPRSAGQQQQQLITSYLGRARGGEASGSAAAVEDEAATLVRVLHMQVCSSKASNSTKHRCPIQQGIVI